LIYSLRYHVGPNSALAPCGLYFQAFMVFRVFEFSLNHSPMSPFPTIIFAIRALAVVFFDCRFWVTPRESSLCFVQPLHCHPPQTEHTKFPRVSETQTKNALGFASGMSPPLPILQGADAPLTLRPSFFLPSLAFVVSEDMWGGHWVL